MQILSILRIFPLTAPGRLWYAEYVGAVRKPPFFGKDVAVLKTLYLIGGTMGVGKTTVCRELKQQLPNCVFLDGDWCWDMHPFTVNAETKAMVMANITACLNNFLHCSSIENILFCWVMHEQAIVEEILSRLDTAGCRIVPISLTCTEAALRNRLQSDIDTGLRTPDILERSPARLPLYERLTTIRIDTTGLTPQEIARRISTL